MANGTAETSGIPLVDFAKWHAGKTTAERMQVAKELADACRTYGFVYITNHGVEPELLKEAFQWSKKLFALKLEEKMLAPHPDGAWVHRGYSYPGLEKVSQVIDAKADPELVEKLRQTRDYKESYEIGSDDNSEQPNVWLPENVLPGFRAFTTDFYWRCFEVTKAILRAMALGIGLEDEDFLLKFHSGHNNQLRLLHYPPVPAAEIENMSVARMPAHSDWGSVTLLFQDDCGGLEVENPHKPGEFLKAPAIENAVVMNVGDLLMRWSNDYLKSTLHRVTLPPLQDRFTGEERMTRERYSIPYFISPDPESVVECLPACTDANNPVKYPPLVQSEYRRLRGLTQYVSKPAVASA